MSLLDEAQALAKRPGGTCGVALLVRRLDENEQAELDELLDADVSSRAAAEALALRGHKMNYQTIQRHRSGVCTCR